MKLFLTAALFLPVLATADPEEWMVKDNPHEIAIWAIAGRQCPINDQDILAEITNVLTRSRIQVEHSALFSLHFSAELQCANESTEAYTLAQFSLNFVTLIPGNDGAPSTFARLGRQNVGGGLYYASIDQIKLWIRADTEDVVADYILANQSLLENGQ